jgi:TolB protein
LHEAVYLDPYSDNALAWSPDSQWLAVLLDDSQDIPDVAVINAASGEARPLAASPARDFSPSWSPDGQQLAIVTDRDGNLEIYVVSISGEKIINLTRSPALEARPAWSPSGRRIAFVSNRESLFPAYLYVMDADGSGVTRLGDLIPTSHLLWLPLAPP